MYNAKDRSIMKNFNSVRGTNDYLPIDAKIRETVKNKILSNYQNNGFNIISTPVLESLEFLNSSEGGDNLKLMFKTIKRGDKLDLTKENLTEADLVEEGLRYDLTVPLVRFYSNNREKLPTPFKAIQIGDSFRAERPQRGRSREFVQCDIDILGDNSINAELELLNTCLDTYKLLGLKDLTLKINDRRILNKLVLSAGFEESELGTVCVTLDKIDKIAMNGVMMELIEKGMDTDKINRLCEIIDVVLNEGIDSVVKFGVEEQYVSNIKYLIDSLNQLTGNVYNIKFDISIVRGQGYYTGTVYEMYTEGFSGAIGGGGRYDKMVGKFSGVDTPAVGFSIGFEPVTMLLKERQIGFDTKDNLALIYDDENIIEVFELKEKLKKDFNVSLFARAKNMKNFYDKIGEVADFVISVRDYKEGKDFKKLK